LGQLKLRKLGVHFAPDVVPYTKFKERIVGFQDFSCGHTVCQLLRIF
jgi:hypothetical protein